MPANAKHVRRYNSVTLPGNRIVHFFNYAANETAAEVVAAGWFNSIRDQLTVGSVIDAVIDADGTPDRISIIVTAVPASGNVTVAYNNDAAGT